MFTMVLPIQVQWHLYIESETYHCGISITGTISFSVIKQNYNGWIMYIDFDRFGLRNMFTTGKCWIGAEQRQWFQMTTQPFSIIIACDVHPLTYGGVKKTIISKLFLCGWISHYPNQLRPTSFRRRSKKISKTRVTDGFPSQWASNAENAFIWWRQHGKSFDDRLLYDEIYRIFKWVAASWMINRVPDW